MKKLDYFLLFAIGACGLLLIYPGNTVWLGDEARLTLLALEANASGLPATHGLIGATGVTHGVPVVWLNQLLLLVGVNPVTSSALKAIFAMLLCCGALLQLSRTLHLPVGAGAAFWFCSPFIWFYLRLPGENAWLLLLSLYSIVAFACFLRDGRIFPLIMASLLFGLMFYLQAISI
ncbi:MAG: hypothetical protein LBM70_05745, partial [Victivallales bacterium]|nr:hypothetical protein [Victivallales bacterium]